MLLQVQRNGDIGSPRDNGSTKRSRSFTRVGSRSQVLFRPAPGRRTLPVDTPAGREISRWPRITVDRANPVMRHKRDTPPWPIASASAAANKRSVRLSSTGAKRSNLCRISASGLTPLVRRTARLSSGDPTTKSGTESPVMSPTPATEVPYPRGPCRRSSSAPSAPERANTRPASGSPARTSGVPSASRSPASETAWPKAWLSPEPAKARRRAPSTPERMRTEAGGAPAMTSGWPS